jgi:hypothetical protein
LDAASSFTASLTSDTQASAEEVADAGGPAESAIADAPAEPVEAPSDDDQESTEPETPAEAEAGSDADLADLESYPESIRDRFKALTRSERRALYEHAETASRERIAAERERADAAEAANRETEAERSRVLETQGKFVGATAIDLVDTDGSTFAGPTYDELTQALVTRRGREQLYSKYGLTEDGAESVKAELDQRRSMLGSAARYFDQQSVMGRARELYEGLNGINGIDPDAMVAGVTPENGGLKLVIQRTVSALEERHQREVSALKRDYDGRIEALTANDEAHRGRVAAAEARRLPTGGRSGGSGGGLTLEQFRNMSTEERVALSGAERDAMMARHQAERARNGR